MTQGNNGASLQFTEEMKGYLAFGAANFEDGYKEGRRADSYFMFHLTIQIEDVDRFVDSSERRAIAEGYIECERLGGRRNVEHGEVNLLVDTGSKHSKHMDYRLFFHDDQGEPVTLSGFKEVQHNVGLDVWADTTTLMTNLLRGHVGRENEPSAEILASGKLKIRPEDFLHQLTTFRTGGRTRVDRAEALEKFGKAFFGDLWNVYGPSLMPKAAHFQREIPLFTTEGVHDAEVSVHPVQTVDKLGLELSRFQRGECQDVVVIAHGLGTSSDMFIMPEHQNLVQHLLDNGFGDVWALESRMSNRYPYNLQRNRFNLDDVALFDLPVALKRVRDCVTRNARVHFIGHGFGAIALCMSLFSGKLEGISSAIVNSAGLTPRVPAWSRVKLSLLPFLGEQLLGTGELSPDWEREPRSSIRRLLSGCISLLHRECNVPACNMLSFMLGAGLPSLYSHDNLHELTHRRIGDLNGGVGVSYDRHLRKMVRSGNTAVKYKPRSPKYSALPDNYFEQAADVRTPLLLVTGETNDVFKDSNQVFHQRLEEIVPGRHKLKVFSGYGHQDVFIGKNAHRDIFPELVEFLDAGRTESGR